MDNYNIDISMDISQQSINISPSTLQSHHSPIDLNSTKKVIDLQSPIDLLSPNINNESMSHFDLSANLSTNILNTPNNNLLSSHNNKENIATSSAILPLKVKIKKWHCLSTWKWNVSEDCCGICRQTFEACCPDCKFPGDDCVPVWGECKHVFHLHCILKWVRNNEKCPFCRAEWKVAS